MDTVSAAIREFYCNNKVSQRPFPFFTSKELHCTKLYRAFIGEIALLSFTAEGV